PRVGQILLCDFFPGFVAPEMVKTGRPVIVIASDSRNRPNLVTVVCLSTGKPEVIQPCHLQLPKSCLPQLGRFQERESWVKGDMIYTVGFHRLHLIQLGKRDPQTGRRLYFKDRLGRDRMREVYCCVLAGLNLNHLADHL
ncbi:MAG TPA: type II toxin-antitoxin system PemK/MazF family toxin, partial [Gammaproteobacteria bacterium]|nr:type II toxin-antitoxin system PemK/MazF family toxin [Gammaproteobacteria bacterium]